MFGKGQKLVNVPGSVVRRLCNTFVVYWTMIRRHHNTKTGGKLFNAFKGFISLKVPVPLGLEKQMDCKEHSRKAVHFLLWRNVNKRCVLKNIESLCEGMLKRDS